MNTLARIKTSKKKDVIIIGSFFIAFCIIIGTTLGVIFSETNSLKKAKSILKKNPLIDG